MNNKTRKTKEQEYQNKFGHIPVDYFERLNWLYDSLNVTDKKADQIIQKRDAMLSSLYYNDINIVLFEEPEGQPRHRYRIITKNNFIDAAISNPSFVHVYQPRAKEDSLYMQRLVQNELEEIRQLICTPMILTYTTFHKTPASYNTEDIFLAEMGIHRPMNKPDWDNIGKKYSDMSNHNIWLDDIGVIEGTVKKFYSILPRIEINIKFLNMLYNKHQYNSIAGRKDFKEFGCEVDYFKLGGK